MSGDSPHTDRLSGRNLGPTTASAPRSKLICADATTHCATQRVLLARRAHPNRQPRPALSVIPFHLAMAEDVSPEAMLAFYKRLYPCKFIFGWLNHEHVPTKRWTYRASVDRAQRLAPSSGTTQPCSRQGVLHTRADTSHAYAHPRSFHYCDSHREMAHPFKFYPRPSDPSGPRTRNGGRTR